VTVNNVYKTNNILNKFYLIDNVIRLRLKGYYFVYVELCIYKQTNKQKDPRIEYWVFPFKYIFKNAVWLVIIKISVRPHQQILVESNLV
jgi:hypothetical protein